MGVDGGPQLLNHLTDLTDADVGAVLRQYYNVHRERLKMDGPTIASDASNMAYRAKSENKSAFVALHCAKRADLGITVVPVADGKRPVTKQATNEHIAHKRKENIEAVWHLKVANELKRDLKKRAVHCRANSRAEQENCKIIAAEQKQIGTIASEIPCRL